MDLISPLLLTGSVALFVHALFSLYLLLYSWEYPERLEASHGPKEYREPKTGFSILLPARDEAEVIAGTIRTIWAANYPRRLMEIIVICHESDLPTIEEVRSVIREIGSRRVKLVTFGGTPINKPRGLNVGLAVARHKVVTIFDAEDDVDPQLFNVVNTVMLNEPVGIVQSGVQLMNFRDSWWSVHNCLEYFFWFKSRLHFHAKVGMIPLGGNTVFIKRSLLLSINGWDETCLTEDADIGLRLSMLREPIRVVYDAQHVTREETPKDVSALVRQRTRWNQGFMHILRKGSWLGLPTWQQRLLAVYTFSYPLVQGPITLLWPAAIMAGLLLKVPVPVALASLLPLYAMLFQMLLMVVGAYMFAREYGLRVPRTMPLMMMATFVPYQWVLGLSAARAAYRELQHEVGWEKTDHVGAHRRPVPVSARPRRAWSIPRLAIPVRVEPLVGERIRRSASQATTYVGRGAAAVAVSTRTAARSLIASLRDIATARARRSATTNGVPVASVHAAVGWVRTAAAARRTSQLGMARAVAADRPAASLAQIIQGTIHAPSEAGASLSAAAVEQVLPTGPAHLCLTCGHKTLRSAEFCRRCGSRMRAAPARPSLEQPAGRRTSWAGSLRAAFVGLVLGLLVALGPFEIILAQIGEPSPMAQPRGAERPAGRLVDRADAIVPPVRR